MTTHQPWKPTCWVGGSLIVIGTGVFYHWLGTAEQPLCELSDDSRAKYAATKATAAILRAMRKPM